MISQIRKNRSIISHYIIHTKKKFPHIIANFRFSISNVNNFFIKQWKNICMNFIVGCMQYYNINIIYVTFHIHFEKQMFCLIIIIFCCPYQIKYQTPPNLYTHLLKQIWDLLKPNFAQQNNAYHVDRLSVKGSLTYAINFVL